MAPLAITAQFHVQVRLWDAFKSDRNFTSATARHLQIWPFCSKFSLECDEFSKFFVLRQLQSMSLYYVLQKKK